ncbi:MAG: RsbRD N-terminal domain-containing protein [Deltaproteobacteria bacterium]
MRLKDLLKQKAPHIRKRWLDLIIDTYPADSRRFLREQKDRFANPVGTAMSRAVEALYQELLHGMDGEKLNASLDEVVRIRAVQEFSPSRAMIFVFLLKKVLREELYQELKENAAAWEELLALESRVDEMALRGFDLYMNCREKVYEIRAKEAKNHVSRLLRKAGLLSEVPGWDSEQKKDDVVA